MLRRKHEDVADFANKQRNGGEMLMTLRKKWRILLHRYLSSIYCKKVRVEVDVGKTVIFYG